MLNVVEVSYLIAFASEAQGRFEKLTHSRKAAVASGWQSKGTFFSNELKYDKS